MASLMNYTENPDHKQSLWDIVSVYMNANPTSNLERQGSSRNKPLLI